MRKASLVCLLSIAILASSPPDCLGQAASGQEPVVVVARATKICQLVGETDREWGQPTINRTLSRCKLAGTDLGVPFRHGDRTYLLFGDTVGPPAGDAIAYTTDTTPEDGLTLDFIADSNGTYRPVKIPGISQGAFEVPMEGTSINGRMYIYHTTDHRVMNTMGRSVVAVSTDDGRTFKYLYDLSRKHFINVSVVEIPSPLAASDLRSGPTLYIFGSGRYRQSDVRLAMQPAREIENPASIRYLTGLDSAGRPVWSGREEEAVALFEQPCVGELSVTYNRFIGKWLMLYNCGGPEAGERLRGINLRTADEPWGPWSEPQVIFEPWTDNGYGRFMHVSWRFKKLDNVHDPGRENEWGGEYGPYQFPDLATGDATGTTIYFTMSTWNPYTVVLMQAKLRRAS